MRIKYGLLNNNIDVTNICLSKLTVNNVITIPAGDNNRTKYFTDPIIGISKNIFIFHNGKITDFAEWYIVKINILTFMITTLNTKMNVDIHNQTLRIHSNLKIKYGTFQEELPEQRMVVRYLTGSEKVLEIGGNVGRNSLVIAFILKNNNNNNFVTLECDKNIAMQLDENRRLNNFNFKIESSALSKRKLIQKGWDTIPSDTLQDGYSWVNTITFYDLKTKYNINFDTLVLDCEGAFYYILMDMPEILDNINLIIMENDYHDISHKQYVDEILSINNFYKVYVESGGWGPCKKNFFEAWKKRPE